MICLPFKFKKKESGCVKFSVKEEFEVKLTLISDNFKMPWRLLKLNILVKDAKDPSKSLSLSVSHIFKYNTNILILINAININILYRSFACSSTANKLYSRHRSNASQRKQSPFGWLVQVIAFLFSIASTRNSIRSGLLQFLYKKYGYFLSLSLSFSVWCRKLHLTNFE